MSTRSIRISTSPRRRPSHSTTIEVDITGSSRAPKIALTSSPQLPQDEAMAMLLFGKGSSSLSPVELLSAAQALAELTGGTPPSGGVLGGCAEPRPRPALGEFELDHQRQWHDLEHDGAAGRTVRGAGRLCRRPAGRVDRLRAAAWSRSRSSSIPRSRAPSAPIPTTRSAPRWNGTIRRWCLRLNFLPRCFAGSVRRYPRFEPNCASIARIPI